MARRRTMPRSRATTWALPAIAALALLVLAGTLAPHAVAKEKLTPLGANQMNRGDQLGFHWDPNVQGIIHNGTNDCFDKAMALKVNGGAFGSNQPAMQTKDGQEFVLRGAVGDIGITRRIRIDLVKGAARYVEVLQNKSKRAVTVTLEVRSMLGSSARTVLTDAGRGVLNGPLEKREVGVIAVHGGGSRPGVLFQLRTARSKVVPQISVQNNRTFVFTWVVKIPAGKSAAVLHSVAQRRWNGPPMGKQLQAEFKPFLERAWASGLPGAVREALVNHTGSAGASTSLTKAEAADQAINEVAAAYEVERGDDSFVLIERDKPLKGTVFGDSMDVKTRLGTAQVAFKEVAVLLGGANMGRSMRLYLRDGEVLAGEVQAEGLLFSTKAGLEIPIDPAGIDALFLPRGETDGQVKERADAFLTQLDGTRLALAETGDARLDAVTPWGDLDIPLDEVVRIDSMREPVPGLWILLANGSKLPVAVQGGAMTLESLRFGPVEVEPGSIAAWNRHRRSAAQATAETEHEPAGPPTTHARLAGDCFLVGEISDERLNADTLAGSTPILLEHLKSFHRNQEEDSGLPVFDFTLKSGEKLQGRLKERLVTLRTPYGTCRAPVLHLLGYRWHAPPVEETEPAPAEDAPEKDAPAKADAEKDAPKKDEPAAKKAQDAKQAGPKAAKKDASSGGGP